MTTNPRNRATRPLSLALAPLLLAACGQWVPADQAGNPSAAAVPDDVKTQTLHHRSLGALMGRYVKPGSADRFVLLDYDGLMASQEDSFMLAQYLTLLSAVDPSSLEGRDQRLAYWINGYNASVIWGVLQRYGGDASFKVTEAGRPFFDDPVYNFGGTILTLNQVEHGVARGKMDHPGVRGASAEVKAAIKTWHQELTGASGQVDSRIHAAFNCAAVSCPNLPGDAPYVYDPEKLDEQLDAAARRWLDSPEKGAGPSGISKLFDWYGEDFVASHGSVEGFIEAFRTGGSAGVDTGTYLDYDWTLNIVGAR
jgi:hypothetical protein